MNFVLWLSNSNIIVSFLLLCINISFGFSVTITVCWLVEINYQNRQWLISMLVNCLPAKSTSLWTKTMVTRVSTGVVLTVVVVQRKERNAVVMVRPERASFLMSNALGSQSTLQHFGAKRNDVVNLFLGQLHLSTPYVRFFFFSTSVWNELLCFLRKIALNAPLLENQYYLVPLWCWRRLYC